MIIIIIAKKKKATKMYVKLETLDGVADDSSLIVRCVDPEIVTALSKILNVFIFRAKRFKTLADRYGFLR